MCVGGGGGARLGLNPKTINYQDRQNVGPPFGTESVPEIFFLKKLILKVSNEKLPIMQSLDPEQ